MEMLDIPLAATPQAAGSRRRLTDTEFCAWIGQAAPGDLLEYHRGSLVMETTTLLSGLSETDRRRLIGLAAAARRAFEAGLVHLVQRRLGPDRFAYLAIARPRPRNQPIALSSILSKEAA